MATKRSASVHSRPYLSVISCRCVESVLVTEVSQVSIVCCMSSAACRLLCVVCCMSSALCRPTYTVCSSTSLYTRILHHYRFKSDDVSIVSNLVSRWIAGGSYSWYPQDGAAVLETTDYAGVTDSGGNTMTATLDLGSVTNASMTLSLWD